MRTPEEFAAGHAAGALNIPVQELESRLAEVPRGPLLLLCRSGIRAGNAFDLLVSRGRPAAQTWYLKGFTSYENGIPRFHD